MRTFWYRFQAKTMGCVKDALRSMPFLLRHEINLERDVMMLFMAIAIAIAIYGQLAFFFRMGLACHSNG